ncbi:hypothetical protein I203_103802 [Kwoniella mangroviensis CBS 8507]|uniref:uncharacterized protein n=1 Tax=Kwoniella mangroviensis CBS 8507 TaxID=1296122 RepID=UPI0030287C19
MNHNQFMQVLIKMPDDSLTPPSGNSRSSSPSGQPQGRIVSGSLKDRIAKFNNPSAPPPVPRSQFPHSQPSVQRGGLIGNRIPSLDPKSAGMINSGGGGHPVGNRRISENRGLIGNRIPSMGSSGQIYLQNQSTGSSNSGSTPSSATIPKPSTGTGTGTGGARSASPSGSVDSSAATLESSNSPITSRSSSPPTSPGAGIPPSLLAASLPTLDDSGPGAATPSSTRAEAGDTVSELSLSIPSTPVATGTPPLPAPEYDLVAPNLKLATANAAGVAVNPMVRGLSQQSSNSKSFAPSVSSSLATASRGSEEETQMMQDVSGVSTPVGTPRAARRELGEGSVVGEGSVLGENDVEELGNRLENLEVNKDGKDDQDVTPEPPKEKLPVEQSSDLPESVIVSDETSSAADDASNVSEAGEPVEKGSRPEEQTKNENPNLAPDLADLKAGRLSPGPNTSSDNKADEISESQPDSYHAKDKPDPNQAPDLDDLKAGKLGAAGDETKVESGPEKQPSQVVGMSVPANAMVGDTYTQNLAEHDIAPDEVKEQGGEAGQRMEDIETADQVIEPGEEESQDISNYTGGINEKEETVFVDPGEMEAKDGGAKKYQPLETNFDIQDDEVHKHKERGASNEQYADPYANQNKPPKNDDPDLINPTYKGDDSKSAKRDPYKPEDKPPTLQEAARPIDEVEKNDKEKEVGDRQELEDGGDGVAEEKSTADESPKGDIRELNSEDKPTQDVDPVEVTSSVAEDIAEPTQPTGVEVPPTPVNVRSEESKVVSPEGEDEAKSPSDIVGESPTTPQQVPSDVDAQDLASKTDQPPVTAIGAEVNKEEVEPKSPSEPKQLNFEPAPISQPASASVEEPFYTAKEDTSAERFPQAEEDTSAPAFPDPPTADPDVEDPISTPVELDIPGVSGGISGSGVTTPIDGNFLKSFPDVPDEDKPRVEVHVSSPVNTPQKQSFHAVPPAASGGDGASEQPSRKDSGDSNASEKEIEVPGQYPTTPIAKIPGKSKSLKNQRLSVDQGSPLSGADNIEKEGGDDREEAEVEDLEATPQAIKPSSSLSKRLSARRSPKSPLLDDEDPGDFEAGEGWAVVTK